MSCAEPGRKRRILCAGIAVHDHVFRLQHFPPPGAKMRAQEFVAGGGGCAANGAVAVARLGGRAALTSPLGGPAGGLVVTNDAGLAERLDAIAYPGLTANFDAGRVAALARTLLDWREHGAAYAREMAATARTLAASLMVERVRAYLPEEVVTRSHQFAVLAADWGGGQAMAKRLRRANILACGIGLPVAPVPGDTNGLRLGTPEIVRRGMTHEHMAELAHLIGRALYREPEEVAPEVTAFRSRFQGLHFIR